MGADGHIDIYDYEKIVAEIGEVALEKLTDSTVYIQELQGKKYLTLYHGDNLYHRGDDWSDRFGYCNENSKNESWYIPKEEFERLWGIIYKHYITSWEIWT